VKNSPLLDIKNFISLIEIKIWGDEENEDKKIIVILEAMHSHEDFLGMYAISFDENGNSQERACILK
jgi:hypothetical protein